MRLVIEIHLPNQVTKMASNDSPKGFPFMKLPPELRNRVYFFALVKPHPIKPILGDRISTIVNHESNCSLGRHSGPQLKIPLINGSQHRIVSGTTMDCKHPFEGTREIRLPSSVLALLLVSRTILKEAVHFFYQYNHFTFSRVDDLNLFLDGIGRRRHHLKELSFKFTSTDATATFNKLQKCEQLTHLHIQLVWNAEHVRLDNKKGRNLQSAIGMAALRKLRGLQVVELVGTDVVYDMHGHRTELDILDSDAVGPHLMFELTMPRVPKGHKNLIKQPKSTVAPRVKGKK